MLRAHVRYFKPGLISPSPASSLISFLPLPPVCPTVSCLFIALLGFPLSEPPSEFQGLQLPGALQGSRLPTTRGIRFNDGIMSQPGAPSGLLMCVHES
ncbi:uncharacterized protein CCOS01_04255 [Colletotrichum costaricense]|uniref:Uncharacterized protein n=1 Tax=Colletotrichum costaricense TaxID=1209916 RepID=A0AAI9Z3N8_9PEZI|nr:uncharacterized protein CCOS01_04255 [Colletotrichum costaricense]KAK1532272.1 hypothetical protein CCOS01_04255 [Colletotrichum costaricense]